MRYKMQLQPLTSLKELQPLQSIKQLSKEPLQPRKSQLLSEIEFHRYTANLCLFTMRILNGEIQIKNSDEILGILANEVMKATKQLNSKDFYFDNSFTKKTTKEFYEYVGLKPKHIKTK
ncbi:MAG: hypothetical protein QG567_2086 [Campylobacterota bacterium]|nr:hypothetical protein [Campylobacterota bacterium]